MGTLAEDVMGGAQTAQNMQGQTVGNAVQAYQLAQKTEMDRQQLETQKQQAEMNKANWVNSQIIAIARQPEGAARNLMIDSFGKQLPSVIPGANMDIPKLMQKDPNVMKNMTDAAVHYANGGQFDPNALNGWFAQATPDAVEALSKNAENIAKIRAASMGMAQVRQQGIDLQAHKSAIDSVAKDPLTNQLQTSFQNLQNAKTNFEEGGATPQDFAELQQAVRANLGIKGQSTGAERSESYYNNLGLKKDTVVQFLSDNPQSVLESNPNSAKQVMGLVDLEMRNKAKQAQQQIDKNASKYASIYKNPRMVGYAGDFQNTLAQQKAQFNIPQQGAQAAQPAQGAQAPVASAPAGGAANGPHEGSTYTYNGTTYVVQGGHWVPQQGGTVAGQ